MRDAAALQLNDLPVRDAHSKRPREFPQTLNTWLWRLALATRRECGPPRQGGASAESILTRSGEFLGRTLRIWRGGHSTPNKPTGNVPPLPASYCSIFRTTNQHRKHHVQIIIKLVSIFRSRLWGRSRNRDLVERQQVHPVGNPSRHLLLALRHLLRPRVWPINRTTEVRHEASNANGIATTVWFSSSSKG